MSENKLIKVFVCKIGQVLTKRNLIWRIFITNTRDLFGLIFNRWIRVFTIQLDNPFKYCTKLPLKFPGLFKFKRRVIAEAWSMNGIFAFSHSKFKQLFILNHFTTPLAILDYDTWDSYITVDTQIVFAKSIIDFAALSADLQRCHVDSYVFIPNYFIIIVLVDVSNY